jgi:hypothetical protein
MAKQFTGKVEFLDSNGNVIFTIDPDAGFVQLVQKTSTGQKDIILLDATHAAVYVGTEGNEGDIFVKDRAGRDVFHFDGNRAALYIGASGNEGDVIVRNGSGAETISLNGGSGDIILSNADCAEDFDICETEQVEPGTVMVFGKEGVLYPSQQAYDKRVAGVVSGAGNYKPGIVLDKQQSSSTRKPIALLGKVYCKVDAQYGAIEIGDLLTTSATPGHAMKVDDPAKAFGAVIGKALRPLSGSHGLIPILIALQ